MDRRFMAILAAVVIIFIGIFAVTQNSSDKNSSGGSKKAQATNHIFGQGRKNVTLVEYGDYQCPVCEAYYLPVNQAVTQLSTDIHFQFRNLPLPSLHPHAFAGARAAEAAGMQGKYFEMHDMLYDQANWQAWTASGIDPIPLFNSYAQKLGLDINKFKQDYSSTKVNDAINADLAAFNKTGKPQATPTFFLDGSYVNNSLLSDPQTGAPSADKFVQLLNAEIAKKNPQ
jgi:protein-disulfide isomerase